MFFSDKEVKDDYHYKRPTDWELLQIATIISTYWSLVGELLGLSKYEIEKTSQAERTDESRCIAMLRTWLHVNQDVTWDDFLSKIDLYFLRCQVSQIKSLLQNNCKSSSTPPTELLELERNYSTMMCKVWDYLSKHPRKLEKLHLKLKFSSSIRLDDPGVYQDASALLSALHKNKIVSQDNVFWLIYLVEDLPACIKIVKQYDQFIAHNLAIREQFSSKGGCMQPLA